MKLFIISNYHLNKLIDDIKINNLNLAKLQSYCYFLTNINNHEIDIIKNEYGNIGKQSLDNCINTITQLLNILSTHQLKLIVINDETLTGMIKPNIDHDLYLKQMSELNVDIDPEFIYVLKNRLGDKRIVDFSSFIGILTSHIIKASGGFVKFNSKLCNTPQDNTNLTDEKLFNVFKNNKEKIIIEEPKLSSKYENNCLWALALDYGDNVEVLMDRIFISQKEAEQGAKELVKEDRCFDNVELTVVGVPFTNISYGKTIPGYVEETIDLSDDTFLQLAKLAHEKDMKLNDLVVELLEKYITTKELNNHTELWNALDEIGE